MGNNQVCVLKCARHSSESELKRSLNVTMTFELSKFNLFEAVGVFLLEFIRADSIIGMLAHARWFRTLEHLISMPWNGET